MSVATPGKIISDYAVIDHNRKDITRLRLTHHVLKIGSVYSVVCTVSQGSRTVRSPHTGNNVEVPDRILVASPRVEPNLFNPARFRIAPPVSSDFDYDERVENGGPYPTVSTLAHVVSVGDVVKAGNKVLRSTDVVMCVENENGEAQLVAKAVAAFGSRSELLPEVGTVVVLANTGLKKFRDDTNLVIGNYSNMFVLLSDQSTELALWYEEESTLLPDEKSNGKGLAPVPEGFDVLRE